jgi:hypothetical protein
VTSKLENELIKKTKFEAPKGGYDDRQDHLAALARTGNKLTDAQFDKLTDDAANWVTDAIKALNGKREIEEFSDYKDDEAGESADEAGDDEASASGDDEATEADDSDGAEADSGDDADAESENEAAEAAADAKSAKRKTAKKAGATDKKPEKPLRENSPNKRPKLRDYSGVDAAKKDRFGVVIGTKTHDAIKMYEVGCTSTEIKKELDGRFYNILKVMEDKGHRVERFPGGKFKLTHREDLPKAKGKK